MFWRPLTINRPSASTATLASRRKAALRRRKASAFGRLKSPLRVIGRRSAPASPNGGETMTRDQLTEKILDIKREKGWTWKQISGEIGGMSRSRSSARCSAR